MGGKPGENLIRGYIFSVRASYSSVSSSRQPDVYSEASFRFSAQSISDSHRFSTRYLLSCQRVFRLFMSYASTHTHTQMTDQIRIKSDSSFSSCMLWRFPDLIRNNNWDLQEKKSSNGDSLVKMYRRLNKQDVLRQIWNSHQLHQVLLCLTEPKVGIKYICFSNYLETQHILYKIDIDLFWLCMV